MTIVVTEMRSLPAWSACPPEGWEPVADVCVRVFEGLPALTARINERIVRDVAAFDPTVSPMTGDDLTWSTSRNISGLLHGIAEDRGPGQEELSFRRIIGQRSAMRALPLDALVDAYRIGFLAVWETLVAATLEAGGSAPTLVLQSGSKIWQWMLSTSAALADGYNAELNRREASEMRATAHFVEEIVRAPESPDCRRLAIESGFDPDGDFRVIAIVGPASAEDGTRALVAALQRNRSIARSVQRGRATVVVAQNATRGAVDDALSNLPPDVPVGVGLKRAGLLGARASIFESERALEAAIARGRIQHFEDDWFSVIALTQRESLEPILSRGIEVARSSPHLASAVSAFVESGFSIATGARSMNLSANAFRHRLTRWHRLTGWSPWSRDGIVHSLAALELVR